MAKHITHKAIGARESQGRLRIELQIIGPERSWVRHCWVTVPPEILPLRLLQSLAYAAEMREHPEDPESTLRLF